MATEILSILLFVIPKLAYSMDDVTILFNNSDCVLLTSSQYCYVNESTIRINDSDVTTINSTGEYIIASNNIDLFIAPANGTNCTSNTSDDPYSDAVYIVQILISSAIIIMAAANLTLHFFIKELQTISGVLIVSLCIFIILNIAMLTTFLTLTGQRNGNVCAVIFYMAVVFYFLYDASKLSTLLHFAYLMYQSYKTSDNPPNKKNILFKYAILIALLSAICSTSFILVDVHVDRTGHETTHGRCEININPSDQEITSIIFLAVELSIFNAAKLGLMIAGLVFYYLTTRQCCVMPTRDVKISIALNCTIGINSGLLVILYFFQVPGDVNYAVASTGTLIEQVLLFFVFFTSNKVLNHTRFVQHVR